MRADGRNAENLRGTLRRALLVLLGGVLVFALSSCGSAASGSHSYVYEDGESVRYLEWTTDGDALSGHWEGVYLNPDQEGGMGEYRDDLAGRVNENTVTLDPASQDLIHKGTVEGGEFRLRWGGEDPGGRTYTEGAREDYEEAAARFREKAGPLADAYSELEAAEEVVYDDLSGFGGRVDSGIDGTIAAVRDHKREIEALPALNEQELEEQRRLADEWSEDYDEPKICTEGFAPTPLDSESLYEPDEAYEWWDVDTFEGQLGGKREAMADAEEALSGLDETPEGAEERLADMEARVEEDAGKVVELEGLVRETNEAYRDGDVKSEEVMREYDRLYDEADCIPD